MTADVTCGQTFPFLGHQVGTAPAGDGSLLSVILIHVFLKATMQDYSNESTTPSQTPSLQLLTVSTVASLLGVSKRTVYRLIRNRRIGFHRIGGCVRVSQGDLAIYIEEQKIDKQYFFSD